MVHRNGKKFCGQSVGHYDGKKFCNPSVVPLDCRMFSGQRCCFNNDSVIALDKNEYLVILMDNLSILHKTYVVIPHLNRIDETVQMRVHNIWF